MSSIDPTSSGTDPYAAINGTKSAPAKSTSSDPMAMNQNDFLTLMLAQLKNQDPTKPQDPAAFMQQLAQFSQVTSTQNMEKSISALTSSLRSNQVMSGTSLVGRSVLAPSTTASIVSGESVSGAVDVPDGASSVTLRVTDSNGNLVRAVSLPTTKGLDDFTWDGTDNTGAAAAAGTYNFAIQASVAGQNTSLDPLLASKVTSVTIDPASDSLTLNTSAGALAMNDVRRVF